MKMDWNKAAETTISEALGMVPEVGGLLSAVISILWPSTGEDVWSQIKDNVEQLIQQDISKLVYSDVQDSLNGLKNVVEDYRRAVIMQDAPDTIKTSFISAALLFDSAVTQFQQPGYELLLLPLFAQFANLNLSLLRDGVQFGPTWGMSQNDLDDYTDRLKGKIQSFVIYANFWYQGGLLHVRNTTPLNLHTCEPFHSVNAYVRQMTFSVLDFVNLWPYFGNVAGAGNPIEVRRDREIYTDPIGTCDNSGLIMLPSPPTMPISEITVWGGHYVDAVQVTYPQGGGPGGKTVTPRMGTQPGQSNQDAGSNKPPHGGVIDVSSNPVNMVIAYAGDIVNALQFNFKNGGGTGVLGSLVSGSGTVVPVAFSYPGEILSSIHINGISLFYGSADSAVFGFKYEASATADLEALRHLYVTSPSSESTDGLAARCVSKPVAIADLNARASAENWDAQRAQYRKNLTAQESSVAHA